jgi:serine/threonine-protein kinase HipA
VKFEPVRALTVFLELREGERTRVGRLALKNRELLFEYDRAFLQSRLELSPFRLPLRAGVFTGEASKFDGLMGVFDDSLPDGWGRLLIDRRAAKLGIPSAALSPLDRLALIGARSMGALVYEPEVVLEPPSILDLEELEQQTQAVLTGAKKADLDRLIALGGSPHGARPKVLVQLGRDGTVVHGDTKSRPGCTHYLVKFRARDDDPHAGTLEHAYLLMAAACGIEVTESRMLGKHSRHPGYLAVRRFDREGKRKLHLHTAAGLLYAPHHASSITYRELLLATRRLTGSEGAVTEMFRRACFNVFAHNRDDHTRNFAFLMDAHGAWRPSPAYDLTFSEGPGGEHTLLIDTEGANPTARHLVQLADELEVRDARTIIERVRATVSRFPRFAEKAGLPATRTRAVLKRLLPPSSV